MKLQQLIILIKNAYFRLVEHGYKFCLITNDCTTAKRLLAQKLNDFGYDCVSPDKIVSPAPVACQYLIQNQLRPRLHIWDGVIEDFEPILEKIRDANLAPNCLVVGDVMHKLSRDYMDKSLELMLNSSDRHIISLGAGRYYKDAGRLRIDTGAYVAAFEYCLGVEAVNVGKPSEAFFREALDVVGGSIEDTIMIGDDIVSDVGGAQKLGMRGFLVRTGKYRQSDEHERGFLADYVFNNLKEAIETIVKQSDEIQAHGRD